MSATTVSSEAGSSRRDAAKAEQAYQQLRQAIQTGEYSPNERLVEAPLSQLLGVSRNTLRTVLARLEQDGFIVLEPNRGARVRTFTLDEAYEVLLVREVLEGLICRLAAERATPEQRAQLRESVEDAAASLERDDLMRYTAANRRFHDLLVEMAGSPKTGSMLDGLRFPVMKFQFQSMMVPGRKTEQLAEHRELLAAVESQDADRAESVARWHIRQIRVTLDALVSVPSL